MRKKEYIYININIDINFISTNARGENDFMFRWTNMEFHQNTLIIKSDSNGIRTNGQQKLSTFSDQSANPMGHGS